MKHVIIIEHFLKRIYKYISINGSLSEESWFTSMTGTISDKSIWAVIALMFLWIELSTSWTFYTISSIPEWKIWWTLAWFIGSNPNSNGSLLVCWAFTLSCCWINLSWGWAWHLTIASIKSSVIEMTLWAWLAFTADWIPE